MKYNNMWVCVTNPVSSGSSEYLDTILFQRMMGLQGGRI
jgi:hypothetical protein